MNNITTKTSLEVLPSKVTSLEGFDYLKTMIIEVLLVFIFKFIFNIVFYMLAISTFNKDNG